MIAVKYKRLIFSLTAIMIITLILLISGLAIEGGAGWNLKLELQNFLFWGIVALIIQLWISGALILSHKKILKSINRLSAFEDLNSLNAEKAIKELGGMGEEIRSVLKKVNELSIMRADRISALNNLTDLLCVGYSEPVVVTDVKGEIFTMSDKLRGRISKETDKENVNNIADIRPEIKLSEVLNYIEKQKSAWIDSENARLTCTPVFDKKSTLQFCIWEFETSFFAEKIKELNKSNQGNQSTYKRLQNIINPFIRRKNGKNRM